MTPNLLEGIPVGTIDPAMEATLTQQLCRREGTPSSKAKAGNRLVIYSLHDAFLYARACANNLLDESEVLSLSYLALRSAVRNFQISKSRKAGFRFFAYVKPYLRGEIVRAHKKKRIVRGKSVIMVEAKVADWVLHTPEVGEDGCHGGPPPVVGHETAYEIDFEAMDYRALWDRVKPIIEKKLSPTAQEILKLHYGGGLSFSEVGEKLGKSRQYVHLEYTKALRKLRTLLLPKKDQFI